MEENKPVIKRLSASERDALSGLNVTMMIMGQIPELLAERTRSIRYAKRDLAMIARRIEKLLEKYVQTIPPEQLKTYRNYLRMCSYAIGVKGPATRDRNDEFGMWVSWNELNALMEGCHDKCLMCPADKNAARSCQLRKALDIIPNDVDHNSDSICPYSLVM